jgi:hypothetical protein
MFSQAGATRFAVERCMTDERSLVNQISEPAVDSTSLIIQLKTLTHPPLPKGGS